MYNFFRSPTSILVIILFFLPMLCLTRISTNAADQTKPSVSKVSPSPAHGLQGEKRETFPSKMLPEQSSNSPRPWWVGDLITVLGILVGVIIVIYQLGRQHKNELRLQRENYVEQLRLNIYEKLSRAMDVAVRKQIDSNLYASWIPKHVKIYCEMIKKGFPQPPLKDRDAELSRLHHELLNASIEVIFLIERNQIIDPRLNIFRIAFSVAHHDMLKTHSPLFELLLKILPFEVPGPDGSNTIVNVVTPSDQQVNELETLVKAYTDANFDMGCYLHDLSIELQNTLLGDFFPHKVPRRKPLDPKFKVISTEHDEMEKLQNYFEEETDWGKEKKHTEQDVLSQLGSD